MPVQKIFLASDHGGFELKNQVSDYLRIGTSYEVQDLGPTQFDPSDDYPQFAFAVATAVVELPASRGILLCRSGAGMAIAANKLQGARAAVATTISAARHARQHNDANILVLGGDDLGTAQQANQIVSAFLDTAFSDEPRHRRRLQQIWEFASVTIRQ